MKEYFSHDYATRLDGKIKLLIRKHGMLGYGSYWAIIEDLYNNANALLLDYEGIAYDLRIDAKVVKSLINDFDLFSIDGDEFGSLSVARRIEERNTRSQKARESALSRWDKNKKDANVMRTQSEGNAIKEKESKANIPSKPVYIYNQFYDEQLKLSNNDPKYKIFIEILFGNNILDRKLNAVLGMKEQVSFNQMKSVDKIKNDSGKLISELLVDMETWLMKNTKSKNTTVLGTLRTFAKPKK